MREVSFERELQADPARALPRLEQWLARSGYQASARSSHEFSFLGPSAGGQHRLTVRADGRAARFTFAPGGLGVTLPDEPELARRVDEALASLGAALASSARTPVAPAPRRCSICATPLGPGETLCPLCGMQH